MLVDLDQGLRQSVVLAEVLAEPAKAVADLSAGIRELRDEMRLQRDETRAQRERAAVTPAAPEWAGM